MLLKSELIQIISALRRSCRSSTLLFLIIILCRNEPGNLNQVLSTHKTNIWPKNWPNLMVRSRSNNQRWVHLNWKKISAVVWFKNWKLKELDFLHCLFNFTGFKNAQHLAWKWPNLDGSYSDQDYIIADEYIWIGRNFWGGLIKKDWKLKEPDFLFFLKFEGVKNAQNLA